MLETSGGAVGLSWHDHSDELRRGQRITDSKAKGGNGYRRETVGWRPTCKCFGHFERRHACDLQTQKAAKWFDYIPHVPLEEHPLTRCVVFDPFTGRGTVGVVALRLAHDFKGKKLKPEYSRMAKNNILNDSPLFNKEVLTGG